MNVNSKTYMQNSEFKERQGSFGFFCAAVAEYLTSFRAECRKGWAKLFKGVAAKFENITLPLPFDSIASTAKYFFDLDSMKFILALGGTGWEMLSWQEGKKYCMKRHRKHMTHQEWQKLAIQVTLFPTTEGAKT